MPGAESCETVLCTILTHNSGLSNIIYETQAPTLSKADIDIDTLTWYLNVPS